MRQSAAAGPTPGTATPALTFARAAPLVLFAAFSTLSKVGEGLLPHLLEHHPLLLLWLNANDVFCGLVGTKVPAPWFYTAVLARRLAEDASCFALGRVHGESALDALQGAFPDGGASVRRTVEALRESPHLGLALIAAWPSTPSCLAAGMTRASPSAFVAVTLVVGAVRATVLRRLGEKAEGAGLVDATVRLLQTPALSFAIAVAAAVSLAVALRKLLTPRTHAA